QVSNFLKRGLTRQLVNVISTVDELAFFPIHMAQRGVRRHDALETLRLGNWNLGSGCGRRTHAACSFQYRIAPVILAVHAVSGAYRGTMPRPASGMPAQNSARHASKFPGDPCGRRR